MTEEVIKQTEAKMKKSVDALSADLAALRTGRASPALVEHIQVDYYGTMTPLKQLSAISVQEGKTIVIQPWDKGAMQGVEKAILKSNLGMTPRVDGAVLRLSLPPLTEERRKEMVKTVHKRVEEGKIAVRNNRRDGIESLRALEKDKKISQDDQKRAEARVQKLTDQYVEQSDKMGSAKEAELLEV
ncbi:MAG: ribosome recycling factor [Dehalococcoidia bacterium]|nr:ribosome recycling factor [Dehalococcoidia bacterium]